MERSDSDNAFVSETPCKDVDALLPPDDGASDEKAARQTLGRKDKSRTIILKMLLAIGTILLSALLASNITLLTLLTRRTPNHTSCPDHTNPTPTISHENLSLTQHTPATGAVSVTTTTTTDDHLGKDLSGAQYLMKKPCGTSAAEARARGCRYGMVNSAWLPEECYDEETEKQFKEIKEWEFWIMPNKTGFVTWEEAATGDFDLLWAEWDRKFGVFFPVVPMIPGFSAV
ncbi:hypothetical protein PMZ80_005148 [Knufia obscura]|uniref:Uncharacterized protein n=1 Tax=Knufia obscura TaxID=1635080 RepID=A0ABR0RPX1_9EURO|nr:hypothetical protein PMZ80_005148 [Knufia obscura]